MLYFAYGSNLNKRAMASRCPKARPMGKFTLPDMKLVFRGVADIEPAKGSKVEGALWLITPECEAALDRYEGVGSGFYRKEYWPCRTHHPKFGHETRVMAYVMNSNGIFPPSEFYLDTIKQGYKDFGMSRAQLDEAVRHSFDSKKPTFRERQRHMRKGRPRLAQRPDLLARAED